jgi:hypothetical protein
VAKSEPAASRWGSLKKTGNRFLAEAIEEAKKA